MPNAQVMNQITCAHPGDCVQPGIVKIKLDGVKLEFCPKHAGKYLNDKR